MKKIYKINKNIWINLKLSVTLNYITPPNNLLLNSYFKNLTIGLHVLNMHANFHFNRMLFTIQTINSFFMYYFKLRKLEFK